MRPPSSRWPRRAGDPDAGAAGPPWRGCFGRRRAGPRRDDRAAPPRWAAGRRRLRRERLQQVARRPLALGLHRRSRGAHGDPRALAAVEPVLRWLTARATSRRSCASMGESGAAHRRRAMRSRSCAAWAWRMTRARRSWPIRLSSGSDRRRLELRPQAVDHALVLLRDDHAALGTGRVRATGDERVAAAAHRTAESFLAHRVFRSHTTGEIGDPRWVRIHYPPYYSYDIAIRNPPPPPLSSLPPVALVAALTLRAQAVTSTPKHTHQSPGTRSHPTQGLHSDRASTIPDHPTASAEPRHRL